MSNGRKWNKLTKIVDSKNMNAFIIVSYLKTKKICKISQAFDVEILIKMTLEIFSGLLLGRTISSTYTNNSSIMISVFEK